MLWKEIITFTYHICFETCHFLSSVNESLQIKDGYLPRTSTGTINEFVSYNDLPRSIIIYIFPKLRKDCLTSYR